MLGRMRGVVVRDRNRDARKVYGAGGTVAAGNGNVVAGAEDCDSSGLSTDYWNGSACDAVDFAGVGTGAGSLVLGTDKSSAKKDFFSMKTKEIRFRIKFFR